MASEDKRKLWEERIDDFLVSGQTQKAWCQDQGCSVYQLQYWLRKLGVSRAEARRRRWVSLQTRSGSGISLRVGHVVLEVEQGFDPEVLTDVVRLLSGIC